MRITNVRIKNFRGIRDLEIELGEFTVLIGENNTGKTSILDALKLCFHNLDSQHRSVIESLDFHLAKTESEPYSADPIEIEVIFSERSKGEWNESLLVRLDRLKISQIDDLGRYHV